MRTQGVGSTSARDAFSGVLLWKRPVPQWDAREHSGTSDISGSGVVGRFTMPAHAGKRLVAVGEKRPNHAPSQASLIVQSAIDVEYHDPNPLPIHRCLMSSVILHNCSGYTFILSKLPKSYETARMLIPTRSHITTIGVSFDCGNSLALRYKDRSKTNEADSCNSVHV